MSGDESAPDGAAIKPTRNRPATASRVSRRDLTWAAAAGVLVLLGVIASFVAAGAVADNQTDEAHKSLQRRSADVASTLQLAIQHENDVLVDASGVVGATGTIRRTFPEWAAAAQVVDRYPEMGGMGVLELVQDADLAAYAAAAEADPSWQAEAGPFKVLPSGKRPFYCFITASISSDQGPTTTQGVDYCANPAIGPPLLAARDSGRVLYMPYQVKNRTWLAIEVPIFRGGAVPPSVEGRREAFAGWVGTQLDPTVLLERAVHNEPGMAVTMRYHDDTFSATFPYRIPAPGAVSVPNELGDGWTVETWAVVEAGSIQRGEALVLLVSGTVVSLLLGLLVFVLGTSRERTRRQLAERTQELHHQALHDSLTGLPNRTLVLDRADQMLERQRRNRDSGAALFLDLDDFKNINDTLGHHAGDHLLVAVAARLGSALRGGDTIGRMGGDEFVVLLDGTAANVDPELVAQRLLDVLDQPFDLPGSRHPISVNVSIGIASGDRETAGELLRDADVALYQAKAAGKSCYAVFDPEMETHNSRRVDLEFDARSALSGGQYRLVYQPIYRLDNLTMVGVEALLRWDHPTKGPVPPDEFIPILEQTGLIGEVGRWVLHQACQQMATWHDRGDRLKLSVNVSPRQLDHDYVVDDIREALETSSLDPSALIIEVTENALMQNTDAVRGRLRAIKELGVRLAIDDFGTGYSSLAYLSQFPVDCLKIDRVFTSAMNTSPEARALVDALVHLGSTLGLYTLAEGVETADEVTTLRDANVYLAQGFLMARPLEPEAIEAQFLAPLRGHEPAASG